MLPKSVHTDELRSYDGLDRLGYEHKTVNHSSGQYVDGDIHVNGVESFWRLFKASIKGTHIHVSGKHLEKYAKEFEFRFNNRHVPTSMFPRLVREFVSAQAE